jgi:hypothetical protein
VAVSIANAPALKSATLYQLTSGKTGVVAAGGTAPAVSCAGGSCTLTVALPATSATTIVLR